MSRGGIRLVTLDLDDTLWPCQPTIQRAEAALFAWLRREAPALAAAHSIESLRAHRRALMAARPEIAHDLTAVRRESLRQLLEAHGEAPALAEAASRRFQVARNRVSPYAEVVEALGRLRERFLLVSVTNGNAEVDATPLAGRFHHSLTAAQAGAAKPHPALFEAACRWAGVPPRQALHLGDDPELDVAAAQAAGLTAAWMNREGRAWPDHLRPPDLEVATLGELVSHLCPDGR